MSLLWMQNEARMVGLRLKQSIVDWDFKQLSKEMPKESLVRAWWALEIYPVRRLKRNYARETR